VLQSIQDPPQLQNPQQFKDTQQAEYLAEAP
jgi:hypothetical protein